MQITGKLKLDYSETLKNKIDWGAVLENLDFALQPIVNPHTGMTYAVELLLRNTEAAGFHSISDFFDTAYYDAVLFTIDVELRKKAVEKFKKILFYKKIKIFYNYDPRVHIMENYQFGATENILKDAGLKNEIICLELSEANKFEPFNAFKSTFENMKQRGFRIALDDFGVGFSSLELFYNSEPDFLKFDRFLISDLDKDPKKRSFCSHLISLAKIFGVMVIAEGVETEKEFDICKRLGFDLVQGYFIQKPVLDAASIEHINSRVHNNNLADKRRLTTDCELISDEIKKIETLNENDSFETLLKKFHNNTGCSFFPVLDGNGYPLGIVHERDIKKYIYSPFGYNILTNRSVSNSIKKFLVKCPIVDINTPQEIILENFMHYPETDGVIVIGDMKFQGFLTPNSLLKIINEKNLSNARELNPLSKLPGNILIQKYINACRANDSSFQYYIYFDFDNFKPFNDRFGFRQGDRIILIFADILRKIFFLKKFFIGHIGGDDFIIGYCTDRSDLDYVHELTVKVLDSFLNSITSMYSEKEYHSGIYSSRDRDGNIREFPLLSAYAAIVEANLLGEFNDEDFQDIISLKLAEIKKRSKESRNKISVFSLTDMDLL